MKTTSHKYDAVSILPLLEKQVVSLRSSNQSDLFFLINFLKILKGHNLLSSNGDQVAKVLKNIKIEISSGGKKFGINRS